MLGTRVGNYEVVSQLGLGGMGVVYLAKHTVLERPAAIKVLRADMSHHHDMVSRFFNEARAATAIRHPGIVEVYDFGYLPDGDAYFIMEYLDGDTLAERVARLGPLPVGYALVVARQIASALQAAHAAQIIHRDLKPENVVVVTGDAQVGGDRVKLLDFGIAKLASPDASQTRTGEVIGTPTYMSPEQCRGAGKVDARADLYSLGCVLYALVCGRPPFDAEGAGDMIAHHLYFPPDPPRKHEPSLPAEVERLILWLLEKEPSARPSSAAELIAALDALDVPLLVTLPARPSPRRARLIAQLAAGRAWQEMTTQEPSRSEELTAQASILEGTSAPLQLSSAPLASPSLASPPRSTAALSPPPSLAPEHLSSGPLRLASASGPLATSPEHLSSGSLRFPSMGNSSTTLSGTSQVRSAPSPLHPQRARRRARWLWSSAAGSILVMGVLGAVLSPSEPGEGASRAAAPDASAAGLAPSAPGAASPDLATELPAPAPAAELVENAIESTPPGAEVLLDGEVVGLTPFAERLARADAARTYVLRLDGYVNGRAFFTGEANDLRRVILVKKPEARPQRTAPVVRPRKDERARPEKPARPSRREDRENRDGLNPFE
jgi:serine/threonine protein kinase